jgi:parallel beta-helix repeat protein
MKARTLFSILTLSLGIQANATNYYFSSSQGNDSRTSSQAQNSSTPWKSIDKLNSFASSLKAGDQILFKSGDTFYGAISTTKSGTTSAPITFSSYGSGAKPVISGLTTVTTWTSLGNGIYESNALPAGTTINSVVINGNQYAMGRYPNANSSNGGYLNFESHGYRYINDNENPLSSSWNGAQLVVRTNRYTMERSIITNISGKTISYSPAFRSGLTDKFGYFVQNSLKALDQFGEWYYNPGTKKIDVYFGSSSPNSNTTVQVSTKEILLTLQGSNIVVNNIVIRGANKYGIWGDWSGMSNLQVKNCTIDFSGVDGIAIANRHDFVMDNTTITNSNSVGVSFYYGNYNPVVKNSTIQNNGTFPGMLQGDDAGKYGIGIYSTEGLTATNNQVINTGYIGILFMSSNNLIQNNLVDNFCNILDDGAGIYTANNILSGLQPPYVYNRKIIGNIVLHGTGAKAGAYYSNPNYLPTEGIYLDDNTMNVDVLNNTVAYCGDAGIYVHNTKSYNIIGNVLYNNNAMQLGLQHDNTGAFGVSGGVIRRNQLFSQSASQYVLSLQSTDNDMGNFASFDSNYYCRPSNEDKINVTNWFNVVERWYNLSGWQSAYSKDWHSKKTPVPVSDPSNILFQYNASTSSKTIKLNGTYVSVTGTKYTNSVTLAPYTSIILLKTSNSLTSSTSASAAAVTNTAVAVPGYIHAEAATLTVKAYPNPSSYYFNVTAQGGSTSEPMTLRVLDLSGRLLQVKTGVTTNSTLQLGQDLVPGSYVLELLQGNNKVEQKVIKLSK